MVNLLDGILAFYLSMCPALVSTERICSDLLAGNYVGEEGAVQTRKGGFVIFTRSSMLAIESRLGRVTAATVAGSRSRGVEGILGQGALVLGKWLLDLGIHCWLVGLVVGLVVAVGGLEVRVCERGSERA